MTENFARMRYQWVSIASSRALAKSLLSPSHSICRYLVDISDVSLSGGALCTILLASTSHAIAAGTRFLSANEMQA